MAPGGCGTLARRLDNWLGSEVMTLRSSLGCGERAKAARGKGQRTSITDLKTETVHSLASFLRCVVRVPATFGTNNTV